MYPLDFFEEKSFARFSLDKWEEIENLMEKEALYDKYRGYNLLPAFLLDDGSELRKDHTGLYYTDGSPAPTQGTYLYGTWIEDKELDGKQWVYLYKTKQPVKILLQICKKEYSFQEGKFEIKCVAEKIESLPPVELDPGRIVRIKSETDLEKKPSNPDNGRPLKSFSDLEMKLPSIIDKRRGPFKPK
jgi:hypothetical protein